MREFVRSVWQEEGYTTHQQEIILPTGIIEVIFDLELEGIAAEISGKDQQLPRCFINGFNTNPVRLNLPSKHTFFGIQFHPPAIRHVLGIPCGEFTNQVIDLTLIDPGFERLWQQLIAARSFNERVSLICSWINGIAVELKPQDRFLCHFLSSSGGTDTTVHSLADNLCYSTRHLHRKMLEISCLNVEEILLYKKFLYAVQLIHQNSLSLTEIAYESRFTDQSHFIRSFKSFAGMTPGQYRQVRSDIPGHLFQDVR